MYGSSGEVDVRCLTGGPLWVLIQAQTECASSSMACIHSSFSKSGFFSKSDWIL